jgi:hypothetical protein
MVECLGSESELWPVSFAIPDVDARSWRDIKLNAWAFLPAFANDVDGVIWL